MPANQISWITFSLSGRRLSCQAILVASLVIQGNASPLLAGFVDETLSSVFAYWRLDDSSHDARRSDLGPNNFASRYERSGVSLGQPSLIPSEPTNSAARFDGLTGGLSIPSQRGLNNGGPWEEQSVLLWFSADDVNTLDEQVIFEEGGTSRGLNIYIREGELFVGGWNNTNDDRGVTSPWISGVDDPRGGHIYLSTPISSGQTYQVGLVMAGDAHGKTGTLTGYLNGQPFGEETGVGRLFDHPAQSSIGRYSHNTYFDTRRVFDQGAGAHFAGVIDEVALYRIALPADRIAAQYSAAGFGVNEQLQAGDADQDFDFDQLDLVQIQIAGKYLTGQPATWGEGDWNAAPGGEPGNPPRGDGQFNQLDIVAALANGLYLTGPYAALAGPGVREDSQTSLIYDPGTGELAVDAPSDQQLTSINVTSATAKFVGAKPAVLGGAFDNFAADNVFKATFGGSFGSISFGSVLPIGIAESDLAVDLSVVGSLAGGGELGDVDLVYIPEPTSALILIVGLIASLLQFRRLNR